MISCIVRVTDRYIDSGRVSLQQQHLDLYVAGQLASVVLFTKDLTTFIKEYKGQDLRDLIASAIRRGRNTAPNPFTGAEEYYYLADR